jgi:hypothetical protein
MLVDKNMLDKRFVRFVVEMLLSANLIAICRI